jgi:sodium/proline symporter
MAQPQVVNGAQQIGENGQALFGEAAPYGFLTIISTMSWGLGYFGMPQVLLKFMAINKPGEITMSRRIANVWVMISLTAAVAIGVIGRVLYPATLLTQSAAENIFIIMSMNFSRP